MALSETSVEFAQPPVETGLAEVAAVEANTKRRWPLKVAALGMSGLLATGMFNAERLAAYGQLAQANIEHVLGEAPDPTSFEYLEEYEVGNGLFMNETTGDYAQVWAHSQALSALHIVSLTPGHEAEYGAKFRSSLGATDSYWDDGAGTNQPGYNASINSTNFGKPERYVDDNLWMGLIHIQAYNADGDPNQLKRAEQIFDLAYQEWDKQQGGIFWQVQWLDAKNHSRAMVSNAPAVQLGAALYQHTGNPAYLPKIEEIFSWMLERKDQAVGVFHDNMRADQTYDTSKYTYVQGVAAGAMADMSQLMPDKYSLQTAVDFSNLALDRLNQGALLHNPAFDAIFFRNLLKIADLNQDPVFTKRVLSTLQGTVDKMPQYPSELLELDGMIQLRAMLLVPAAEYSKLF